MESWSYIKDLLSIHCSSVGIIYTLVLADYQIYLIEIVKLSNL